MYDRIKIDNVHFQAANSTYAASGLLGWISATLNNSLQLDGLALRKTRDGRFVLSFPARTDGAGRQHHYLRPLNDDTRRIIERQVFAALAITEKIS